MFHAITLKNVVEKVCICVIIDFRLFHEENSFHCFRYCLLLSLSFICSIFNIQIHSFQVKQLYNKVNGQAESLKGLWVAKLNLKDRSALATPEDLLAYDSKKQEVNIA